MKNLPQMPEVKFNKNGYEIRTEVLNIAKDFLETDFQYRWQRWDMSVKRDEKTNQVVTTVGIPEFPGLQQLLETAEKLYSFVDTKKK